jgi:predicted HD superfamily hydrolase involved in NAD metabolism
MTFIINVDEDRGALIESTTNRPPADMGIAPMKDWLSQRLSSDGSDRFQHSLGALKKAIELSEKFSLSPEDIHRVSVAALLHDSAKLMKPQDLVNYCETQDIVLIPEDADSPPTLHAFVGAEIVRKELDIEDPVILNAIRYHTTGRSEMSVVEKIVFVADKIEENTRNPLFVQKVTAHLMPYTLASLDETMLYLLDSTMQYLIEKRHVIHSRSLAARNDFIHKCRLHRSALVS